MTAGRPAATVKTWAISRIASGLGTADIVNQGSVGLGRPAGKEDASAHVMDLHRIPKRVSVPGKA